MLFLPLEMLLLTLLIQVENKFFVFVEKHNFFLPHLTLLRADHDSWLCTQASLLTMLKGCQEPNPIGFGQGKSPPCCGEVWDIPSSAQGSLVSPPGNRQPVFVNYMVQYLGSGLVQPLGGFWQGSWGLFGAADLPQGPMNVLHPCGLFFW